MIVRKKKYLKGSKLNSRLQGMNWMFMAIGKSSLGSLQKLLLEEIFLDSFLKVSFVFLINFKIPEEMKKKQESTIGELYLIYVELERNIRLIGFLDYFLNSNYLLPHVAYIKCEKGNNFLDLFLNLFKVNEISLKELISKIGIDFRCEDAPLTEELDFSNTALKLKFQENPICTGIPRHRGKTLINDVQIHEFLCEKGIETFHVYLVQKKTNMLEKNLKIEKDKDINNNKTSNKNSLDLEISDPFFKNIIDYAVNYYVIHVTNVRRVNANQKVQNMLFSPSLKRNLMMELELKFPDFRIIDKTLRYPSFSFQGVIFNGENTEKNLGKDKGQARIFWLAIANLRTKRFQELGLL